MREEKEGGETRKLEGDDKGVCRAEKGRGGWK